MEIREDQIDQLLQARSEIDEELRRHKTRQTVLFTDIVGSTTYFDRFGDTEGLLLLYQHDALVKGAVEEFRGVVIKTIGDSVMAEFPDPLLAVQASIAMQRFLMERNESLPRSERLQIRIGIHTGFGFKRANDLFGDLVNVAARITKSSGPAQILISQSVLESIPPTELSVKSLGPIYLDGKAGAEELFEVYWADTDVYDMIRSSFSAFSPQADGESPGVTIHDYLVSRMRSKALRTLQWVRLWPDKVLKVLHQARAATFVKPAMAFAVYGLVAVGIVSGRADTRLPLNPEIPPAQQPAGPSPSLTQEVVFEEAPIPAPAETLAAVTLPMRYAAPKALPPAAVVVREPVVASRQPELPPAAVMVREPAVANRQPELQPAAVVVREPVVANRQPDWMKLMDTVPIPAGTFMMGDNSGKGDEKPRHQVKLDSFHIGRTEITNRQYLAFLLDTGHVRPRDPGFAKNYLMDFPNLPVLNVSYDDAIAFCEWASQKYDVLVRLPTEAEWEYAAIGGKHELPVSWGALDPTAMARFKGNAPGGVKTVSSDEFPPNSYGLYNMSGNVWEWTYDFYSKDYYQTSPVRSPKGPTSGTKQSIRGGSWADDSDTLRVTRRSSRYPAEHSDQVGFRIVVVPEPAPLK